MHPNYSRTVISTDLVDQRSQDILWVNKHRAAARLGSAREPSIDGAPRDWDPSGPNLVGRRDIGSTTWIVGLKLNASGKRQRA